MSIADFCVIGFPRCGTTATIRMLKASPALRVHFNPANDKPEAPFHAPQKRLSKPEADPERKNGHKFSAYIYSNQAIQSILNDKPDALLLINVRPAGEALLSWRELHRRIAGRPNSPHFAARIDQRAFFAACSEAEYFEAYAKPKLNYTQKIRKLLRIAPAANFLVITQQRLSRDARGVMREIHDRLGLRAPDSYYEALPSGHKPRGSRDVAARVGNPDVVRQLTDYDADLTSLMSELDPRRVLRAEANGF